MTPHVALVLERNDPLLRQMNIALAEKPELPRGLLSRLEKSGLAIQASKTPRPFYLLRGTSRKEANLLDKMLEDFDSNLIPEDILICFESFGVKIETSGKKLSAKEAAALIGSLDPDSLENIIHRILITGYGNSITVYASSGETTLNIPRRLLSSPERLSALLAEKLE